MKKLTRFFLFMLPIVVMQFLYFATKTPKTAAPTWLNEVAEQAEESLNSPIERSVIPLEDPFDGQTYQMYRLSGSGFLENLANPLEVGRDLFYRINIDDYPWQEDNDYAADGHGSTSFAFRRLNQLCITGVWINSSDGFEPQQDNGEYFFTIDCRESEPSSFER